MAHDTHCFACGRKLGKNPKRIGCQDDQTADVGTDCFRLIQAAGANGYQPPKGGPRLYLLEHTGRLDH